MKRKVSPIVTNTICFQSKLASGDEDALKLAHKLHYELDNGTEYCGKNVFELWVGWSSNQNAADVMTMFNVLMATNAMAPRTSLYETLHRADLNPVVLHCLMTNSDHFPFYYYSRGHSPALCFVVQVYEEQKKCVRTDTWKCCVDLLLHRILAVISDEPDEIEQAELFYFHFNGFASNTPHPHEHPIMPLASAIFGQDEKLVAFLMQHVPQIELDIWVPYTNQPVTPRWESAETWAHKFAAPPVIHALIKCGREQFAQHLAELDHLLRQRFPTVIANQLMAFLTTSTAIAGLS